MRRGEKCEELPSFFFGAASFLPCGVLTARLAAFEKYHVRMKEGSSREICFGKNAEVLLSNAIIVLIFGGMVWQFKNKFYNRRPA